jgi:hypothetical protein
MAAYIAKIIMYISITSAALTFTAAQLGLL